MIVCKFGGSSLSDGTQIRKACQIMLDDPNRRIMVVSAPGVRMNVAGDRKVTDLLIDLARSRWAGLEGRIELLALNDRLFSLTKELGLSTALADDMSALIVQTCQDTTVHHKRYFDAIKALGEEISARLVTAYLQSQGVEAVMVDPREIGLILSYRPGVTDILPETYDNLRTLACRDELIVFPGFYGRTEEGETITFSRGGSDISGAVVAAAVEADLYENWTDMDCIYSVNPQFIHEPEPLREISYREMRELAYIGFSILHPEAIEPLFVHNIPIRICNTNNVSAPGTMIVAERTHIGRVITGIASADDFCIVNLQRVLINREVGILAEILTVFAENKINVEHVPSGIDSLSIIVRGEQFSLEDEQIVRERLRTELGFENENIEVVRNLSVVMIVGEGMCDTVGVIARATHAIAEENISLEVILSDYHEISCLFIMSRYERSRAIHALYREFFEKGSDAMTH